MKDEPQLGEFEDTNFIKDTNQKYYKELLKLSKKTNNSIKKMGRRSE